MKKVQTHLKYGGLTGLVMVIIGLIMHVAGVDIDSKVQYVTYIPFVVGIVMNAMAYSKANNEFVSFGGVFSSGFKAAAIITLITLAWSILAMAIFPEMKEKGMEMAQTKMAERGMSDEQMEQTLEMTRKYFTVFMIGGIMFSTMFWGAIFSLIGAAVAKKKGEGMPQAQ